MKMKQWLIVASLVLSIPLVGDTPPSVRVLVAEQVAEVQLEVTGRHKIYNARNGERIAGSFFSRKAMVVPLEEGLMWGEEFPSVYQFTVRPTGKKATCMVNGVQYGGVMHVYHIGDHLSVVNEVPVEDYCKAVLSTQAKRDQSQEVHNALAIATRTHAYYDANQGADKFFDVRADDVDYRGSGPQIAAPYAVKAIDNTRSIVLEQDGIAGQTFPAVWTENCAGKTAPYHVIFRKAAGPDLPGVEVPLAQYHREESEWNVMVPKSWLAKVAKLDDLTALSLYVDPFSHKVYAMRLFNEEEACDVDFMSLVKEVGKERLLSTDFTAEISGDHVVLTGYGRGHGVGICLQTAGELAKKGKNAADILRTFYPNARLRIAIPDVAKPQSVLARQMPQRGLEDY